MLELVLVRMHAAEDHIILHLELVALIALPRHLDLRCLWMEFRLPDGATLPDPILQITLVHSSISFGSGSVSICLVATHSFSHSS